MVRAKCDFVSSCSVLSSRRDFGAVSTDPDSVNNEKDKGEAQKAEELKVGPHFF